MKCPSCGKEPVGFLRFLSFRRRGVSIKEAIKGNIKCRHCGTDIQIREFSSSFLIFMGILFAVFFVYWMVLSLVISLVGYKVSMGILILWFILVLFGLTYVRWRKAEVIHA
jgi:hypothetical protein